MKRPYNNRLITNSYYMFGKHSVVSALLNPARDIEKVWCIPSIFKSHQNIINKYNYEIVDSKIIDKILKTDHNHQGIIAKVTSIFSNNLNEINFNQANIKIAILDQITDSSNIGAIIRSAVAFGINYILLPYDHSPAENGTIAKAAAGTIESIKIINIVNIKNTVDFLKSNGFWVIGLDIKGEENFSSKIFNKRIVMILGSEDKGMRKLTQQCCDYLIKIPLKNNVESLNVSTAAAIVFYLSSSNISD